jgi:hypothetical protein
VKLVINAFETMIKQPTQVGEITYSKEKQTHTILFNGGEITVSLVK